MSITSVAPASSASSYPLSSKTAVSSSATNSDSYTNVAQAASASRTATGTTDPIQQLTADLRSMMIHLQSDTPATSNSVSGRNADAATTAVSASTPYVPAAPAPASSSGSNAVSDLAGVPPASNSSPASGADIIRQLAGNLHAMLLQLKNSDPIANAPAVSNSNKPNSAENKPAPSDTPASATYSPWSSTSSPSNSGYSNYLAAVAYSNTNLQSFASTNTRPDSVGLYA